LARRSSPDRPRAEVQQEGRRAADGEQQQHEGRQQQHRRPVGDQRRDVSGVGGMMLAFMWWKGWLPPWPALLMIVGAVLLFNAAIMVAVSVWEWIDKRRES
jgi:hypothetical protein